MVAEVTQSGMHARSSSVVTSALHVIRRRERWTGQPTASMRACLKGDGCIATLP